MYSLLSEYVRHLDLAPTIAHKIQRDIYRNLDGECEDASENNDGSVGEDAAAVAERLQHFEYAVGPDDENVDLYDGGTRMIMRTWLGMGMRMKMNLDKKKRSTLRTACTSAVP